MVRILKKNNTSRFLFIKKLVGMLRRWLKSIPVDWKVGEEKVEQEKMEQEKTEEEKIDNNERNQSMLYENNDPLLDNPSANEEE